MQSLFEICSPESIGIIGCIEKIRIRPIPYFRRGSSKYIKFNECRPIPFIRVCLVKGDQRLNVHTKLFSDLQSHDRSAIRKNSKELIPLTTYNPSAELIAIQQGVERVFRGGPGTQVFSYAILYRPD